MCFSRSVTATVQVVRLWGIIVCAGLCSHCSEKMPTTTEPEEANETSLKAAVAHADRLFAAKDAQALVDVFVSPSKVTPEQNLKQMKSLVESEPPVDFTFESCKVSGKMGVALVSFGESKSQYTFFARWTGSKWKFFFVSITWVDRREFSNCGLSEQEQKDAVILQQWAARQAHVGESGIGSYERLGWYLASVPKSLMIEKFYETPSPSMDHEYMWKIKIEDTKEFKKFALQLSKPPANMIDVNGPGDVVIFESHPSWWKQIDFTTGEMHKYFVTVIGSNGGEKATIVALFDKAGGYLYIQAL